MLVLFMLLNAGLMLIEFSIHLFAHIFQILHSFPHIFQICFQILHLFVINFYFINQFLNNLFMLKHIFTSLLFFHFLVIRISFLIVLSWTFEIVHFRNKIGDAWIMRFQGFENKLKIILEIGLGNGDSDQILGWDFFENCRLDEHQ